MSTEELYADGWAGKGETAADELHRAANDARKTMSIETALAHIETFIAGGDELGELTEPDALNALAVIRAELAALRARLAAADNLITNYAHHFADCDGKWSGCSCGYDVAWKAYRASAAPEGETK